MFRTRVLLLYPIIAATAIFIPATRFQQGMASAVRATSWHIRVVADDLPRPAGIAYRDGLLWVATKPVADGRDGSLVRLDLSTRSLTLLQNGPDVPASFALGPQGEVLWTRPADGALVSQSRPGALPRVLREGLRLPGAIASGEEQSVYWVEDLRTPSAPDATGVLALDRGRVRRLLASGARPTALAVSPQGDVFLTNGVEGLLQRVRPDGRSEVLLRGLRSPAAIALSPDGHTVYFTEVPARGVADDRNSVNAFDLRTLARSIVARGDPDPAGLAAGDHGSVFWSSTSRGMVLQASPVESRETADSEDSDDSEDGSKFKARVVLSGSQETPPVDTLASGKAKFELKEPEAEDDDEEGGDDEGEDEEAEDRGRRDGSEEEKTPNLKYSVHAKRLVGFTAAHIHVGAPGQPGPIVAPLPSSRSQRSRSGEVELQGRVRPSDLTGPLAGNWIGFVAALRTGGLYVNLHTEAHPGGEIRGQIGSTEPPVELPPDGTITSPAGDVTVDDGQAVFFAGSASDPNGDTVTVFWDFGDGGTSTSLTPGDHPYTSPGTYVVTFTATDSGGLADPTPDTRTVTVLPPAGNQPPNGTITSPAGNVTITAGQSVPFAGVATDPDGDMVTVLWTFGDGSSSTELNPGDHTFSSAGTFSVTLVATDSSGLADPTPDTRTVTVEPATTNLPPDGMITSPSGDVTITAGQAVSFAGNATDPNGDAVTVLWDFGDGSTSTALMPGDHAFPTAGTYVVTFTATDSQGLADPTPATVTVTVDPAPPTATLTMVQTTVFTPKCTGCHGGSSPTAGMNLEAGMAWSNLVNVPATTQAGVRVSPGQPSNSVLYEFLVAGHRSSSVTDADRQLIYDWIAAGAPDN